MTNTKPHIFAGFWRRLFAWLKDAILLSVVCGGAGWLAIDTVSTWGSNGRCVGLVAGILYFGILSSGLGGGRTLAMRMLGLKVVTVNGKPLGLAASLLRAIVLIVPLILNGWVFPSLAIPGLDPTLVTTILQVLIITLVFGVTAAQAILMLFAGLARRLVHDLASGAVVVRAETRDFTLATTRIANIAALVVVLAALAASLALPSLMHTQAAQKLIAETAPQRAVQDAVNALPEIVETGVSDNSTTFYDASGQKTTRTLIVTARPRTWPADPARELARIGATTVKAYRFAPGQRLQVKIIYGFDMGFGSYNNAQSSPFSTACTTAEVKCLK